MVKKLFRWKSPRLNVDRKRLIGSSSLMIISKYSRLFGLPGTLLVFACNPPAVTPPAVKHAPPPAVKPAPPPAVKALPAAMSYDAVQVKKSTADSTRAISVNLKGGVPAGGADYAFKPPASKPAWLNISGTGTLSGTVPNTASTTTYTIRVTGKGIYSGTKDVPFTLTVNPAEFRVSYSGTTTPPTGTPAALDMGSGKDGTSTTSAYDITINDADNTELEPALSAVVAGDPKPSVEYSVDDYAHIVLLNATKISLDSNSGKITKQPTAGSLSKSLFIITVKGKSGTLYEGCEKKVYIYGVYLYRYKYIASLPL